MPLVNRTFDQLIDFTRTSAATFVNSSGNIASTPQSRNLLTFTQEFDNAAWTATRASVTANSTTAPDGTSTADTLVEDSTASNSHRIQRIVNIPGSAITFSLYMKASGRNWAYLRIDDASTTRFAYFNLATGVVGTVNAGLTATITSVGNGWYRCVTTLAAPAATATGNVVFGSATADNSDSYTGTGIASIFIWGAQLEQASAVTDYTRNFGGLFPPRFDYDPVTRAPRGLLIEEQRTNLFTYSEQFDNAAWAKTNATVTANSTTSPDGTVNADTLVEDTATSTHRVSQGFSSASGTSYTFTIYAKASTRNWLAVQFNSSAFSDALSRTAYVNLSTGAVGTVINAPTVSVTNAGSGWYRIAVTIAATATSAGAAVLVYLANADNSVSYTGDGTSGFFLYGAQLEAGAFATSYIPTVASQVTRTADVAAINAPNFASWFNNAEGTLLVEATATASGARVATLSAGTVDNQVWTQAGAETQQAFQVYTSGSFVAQIGVLPATATKKIAAAFKANDFAVSVNGGAVTTDTSGAIGTFDRMHIGSRFDGTAGFTNGHIRSIRYYPTRLTNAQLQALTA